MHVYGLVYVDKYWYYFHFRFDQQFPEMTIYRQAMSMLWATHKVELELAGLCAVGVFLESTTEFTVDARSVVPRGGKVKAFVTGPSGTRTEALVNNNNDGTYKCMYTPYEQGMSLVLLQYG